MTYTTVSTTHFYPYHSHRSIISRHSSLQDTYFFPLCLHRLLLFSCYFFPSQNCYFLSVTFFPVTFFPITSSSRGYCCVVIFLVQIIFLQFCPLCDEQCPCEASPSQPACHMCKVSNVAPPPPSPSPLLAPNSTPRHTLIHSETW